MLRSTFIVCLFLPLVAATPTSVSFASSTIGEDKALRALDAW